MSNKIFIKICGISMVFFGLCMIVSWTFLQDFHNSDLINIFIAAVTSVGAGFIACLVGIFSVKGKSFRLYRLLAAMVAVLSLLGFIFGIVSSGFTFDILIFASIVTALLGVVYYIKAGADTTPTKSKIALMDAEKREAKAAEKSNYEAVAEKSDQKSEASE